MVVHSDHVFHYTLKSNLENIAHIGLSPEYATGDLFAVWVFEYHKSLWARTHVAHRHQCGPNDIVLLRIDTTRIILHRTRWEGVYYTPYVVPPVAIALWMPRVYVGPITELTPDVYAKLAE